MLYNAVIATLHCTLCPNSTCHAVVAPYRHNLSTSQIDIWWYIMAAFNDMSCRKKAQFYVRIQLHSDSTTWLQTQKHCR